MRPAEVSSSVISPGRRPKSGRCTLPPPPPPGPPPPPPRQAQLSAAQQERLRREYQSFGGSPDVASTNWALYIILFILFLVAASVLTGAL